MARILHCPRDGTEAHLESVKGHRGRFELDVCPKCGGSWFDKGEIAKASGDREVEHLMVAYAGGPTGLACPKCGREMAKRPVGGVTFSVCTKCKGVWADAGELEDAAGMLGGEFSDVSVSSSMLGLARCAMIAQTAFMGFASPSLRTLLNPTITRRYPRDEL